jgi:hypothetical protein
VTYQINYDLVSIAKYHKPVLKGDVAVRLRELIREIWGRNYIEILKVLYRPEQRATVAERAAEPIPEPSDASDQRKDVAPDDEGLQDQRISLGSAALGDFSRWRTHRL